MHNATRAFVVVFFLAWFGVSVWSGFLQTEAGLRLSDVSNDGSYQKAFASILEEDFQMFSAYVIVKTEDFPAAQQQILNTLTALQSSPYVSDVPRIQALYWLNNLLESYNGTSDSTPIPENEFYDEFATWIGASGVVYLNDLYCIDTSNNDQRISCTAMYNAATRSRNPDVVLLATRGLHYLQNLEETDDFLDAIRDTRNRIDAENAKYADRGADRYTAFGYSYVHQYWDQYLHSDYDLFFIVGMCLLGVFIVTILFTFNLTMALILCTIIFMVVVELLGLLPIWDVKINGFSLVNLCLAVGMAVEFTAHIAHEFIAQQGNTRRQRSFQAVAFMGTAMFHGAVSSFLSTCFIAGSTADFVVDVFFGALGGVEGVKVKRQGEGNG